MTDLKKSTIFGLIALWISASGDTFAITVRTAFKSHNIHRHELWYFIFARFVPVFAFGVGHNVSLTYIYNALATQRVYKFLLQTVGPSQVR